jgi:hypothetical protein
MPSFLLARERRRRLVQTRATHGNSMHGTDRRRRIDDEHVLQLRLQPDLHGVLRPERPHREASLVRRGPSRHREEHRTLRRSQAEGTVPIGHDVRTGGCPDDRHVDTRTRCAEQIEHAPRDLARRTDLHGHVPRRPHLEHPRLEREVVTLDPPSPHRQPAHGQSPTDRVEAVDFGLQHSRRDALLAAQDDRERTRITTARDEVHAQFTERADQQALDSALGRQPDRHVAVDPRPQFATAGRGK